MKSQTKSSFSIYALWPLTENTFSSFRGELQTKVKRTKHSLRATYNFLLLLCPHTTSHTFLSPSVAFLAHTKALLCSVLPFIRFAPLFRHRRFSVHSTQILYGTIRFQKWQIYSFFPSLINVGSRQRRRQPLRLYFSPWWTIARETSSWKKCYFWPCKLASSIDKDERKKKNKIKKKEIKKKGGETYIHTYTHTHRTKFPIFSPSRRQL